MDEAETVVKPKTAGIEAQPEPGPHIHLWRTVFKTPPLVQGIHEYRRCGPCGAEEPVSR